MISKSSGSSLPDARELRFGEWPSGIPPLASRFPAVEGAQVTSEARLAPAASGQRDPDEDPADKLYHSIDIPSSIGRIGHRNRPGMNPHRKGLVTRSAWELSSHAPGTWFDGTSRLTFKTHPLRFSP